MTSPARPAEAHAAPHADERARAAGTVLLAGTGRSGTTWLAKLLDASPVTWLRHEPDSPRNFAWFRDLPSRIERDAGPGLAPLWEAGLAAAERHHSHLLSPPPDFEKHFLRLPVWRGLRLIDGVRRRLAPQAAPLRIPGLLFRDAPVTVVKSVVSNLRLAWLHDQFPELRIVLLVRHPGGYVNSWLTGSQRGFGSRERLFPVVLPFPRAEQERYAEAFEHGSDLERELVYWIVANETPLLELAGSGRFRVVVYEELCRRPAEVMDELLAWLGLPFDEGIRRFIDASTSRHSDGYYDVFKDPAKVAEKWRDELSAEQVATVGHYLQGCELSALWPGG